MRSRCSSFSPNLSIDTLLAIILTFAIAFRLVTLFPNPYLSSDIYRYAWDGVVQHAHISPYRYVPGDPALEFLRKPNQDLFNNINRRDYALTIYPPVAQFLFYIITFISPTMTFMKMAMVLFEGLTLFALLKLLHELGVRREQSLLYAWCPLLVWEIGSSGHLDSAAMAFIALALLARYRRQPMLTGLFLGLAIMTKFYPLVLFPALYRRNDYKMPATRRGRCRAGLCLLLERRYTRLRLSRQLCTGRGYGHRHPLLPAQIGATCIWVPQTLDDGILCLCCAYFCRH